MDRCTLCSGPVDHTSSEVTCTMPNEEGSLGGSFSVVNEVVLQGDIHPRYATAMIAAQLSHLFDGPVETPARILVAAAFFRSGGGIADGQSRLTWAGILNHNGSVCNGNLIIGP